MVVGVGGKESEEEKEKKERWCETVAGIKPFLNLNGLLIELVPGKQMAAAKNKHRNHRNENPNSIRWNAFLTAAVTEQFPLTR